MRWTPCLVRSAASAESVAVALGDPLVDDYLVFVAARCRPNTVLATAHDLKVIFEVVGKEPARVIHRGRVRVHRRVAGAASGAAGGRRGGPVDPHDQASAGPA